MTQEMDDSQLFDDGFAINDGDDQQQTQAPEPAGDSNVQPDDNDQQQTQQADAGQDNGAQQQDNQPLYYEQQNYMPPQQQYAPPVRKTVEIPAEIAGEYEKLKQLNPEAAALAEEDSPQGQMLRERLEEYGANLALDRAEHTIAQRQREQAAFIAQQQAQEAKAREYYGTLQRDHPEYLKLVNDPNRKAEAQQLFADIRAWIFAKPYSEAQQLVEYAKHGNGAQVSSLLTQFERERNGTKAKRPDPTAALAVPGRGAPNAPTGFGDRDSFDDGWNLNESER